MKRSSLFALVLLHLVAPPAAQAATITQLALPSQQVEGPPSTPVGDPYAPPVVPDVFDPESDAGEEASPLNPADN